MRFKIIAPKIVTLTVMATALSACSTFQPDYYDCSSSVTSYAEGVRASLTAERSGQSVEARLNGVSAKCYDEGANYVAEIAIGLKVQRNLDDNVEVDPVVVPMALAIIDKEEAVVETSSFIYTMQFTDGGQTIYPLVRREVQVPQGGRMILSLTPELLQQ